MRKVRKLRFKRVLFLLLLLAFGLYIYQFLNNDYKVDNINLNYTDSGDETNNDFDVLVLVNKNNKIPINYEPELTEYHNFKIASVMISDLKDMYNAALKENVYLEINTAYRSKDDQQKVFDDSIINYVQLGYTYDVAMDKTKRLVAEPGYSEHETGLAIDFTNTTSYNKKLDVWNWLEVNAYKYGFILRYPKNKENITGYDYEQWHYRYVGRKYAKIVYESDLCLEEYLDRE